MHVVLVIDCSCVRQLRIWACIDDSLMSKLTRSSLRVVFDAFSARHCSLIVGTKILSISQTGFAAISETQYSAYVPKCILFGFLGGIARLKLGKLALQDEKLRLPTMKRDNDSLNTLACPLQKIQGQKAYLAGQGAGRILIL
jgi:hypothetical protein